MSLSITLAHRYSAFDIDVAFEAPPGVTALFGHSGTGKTTIVNAIAGLFHPQQGHAVVNGKKLFDTKTGLWLPPHRRRVGYVFQDGRLFPHLSVSHNLRFGGWFAGTGTTDTEFVQVVELLGIRPLLQRHPTTLSGGEKQRVAIGRALLSRPQVLLLDEPLAALDEQRKSEILPYLERLRDHTDIPILYVSHSVAEVARLATTIVVLRQGRVWTAGPAEEILSDPNTAPALGVREVGAILNATVLCHHEDELSELAISAGTLFLPRISSEIGAQIRVRIHAQDVILSRTRPDGLSALNILSATVTELHAGTGPGVMVQLVAGKDHLLARLTRRSVEALALQAGSPCYAIIKSVAVARSDVWSIHDR